MQTTTCRTKIVLGSATHHDYIDVTLFDLAKQFACLPPAQIVTSTDNIVVYEVPVFHISGNVDVSRHHIVETDTKCSFTSSEAIHEGHLPLRLIQKRSATSPQAKDFDRISIIRETVHKDSFLLKNEALYSHVNYIKERTDAVVEGWGYQWTLRFQQQWTCPYYSLSDIDSIIFRCRPVYSVHIMTCGNPSIDIIEKLIDQALPKTFRGGYQQMGL